MLCTSSHSTCREVRRDGGHTTHTRSQCFGDGKQHSSAHHFFWSILHWKKKKKAKKRIVVTVGNKTRRISEEQDLAITPMCVNSLQLIHKRPRGSSTAKAPGAELREDTAPGLHVDIHRKGRDFSCCWRQPPLPQLSMLPAPQLLFPERERPGSMEAPHCASSKETLFSVPT